VGDHRAAAADAGRANAAEERQRRPETLEKLRGQGVQLVVIGQRERTAMLGSRTVQVGDIVEGFRVKEIHPHGVVLEEPEP
jgi:hypothetical protein